MKHSVGILTFLVISIIGFGQNKKMLAFDTSSTVYYAKTDFSFIDTLKLWSYRLDTTYKGTERDSFKPIGRLTFWRTKPIDDGSERLYNKFWTPRITFEIFTIAELTYCRKQSNQTRFLSSCVPPQVGGDIIVVGKFVLLNRDVCLSCQRNDTKADYCRPVLNYIFSGLDQSKITNLLSIVSQFPISAGQIREQQPK